MRNRDRAFGAYMGAAIGDAMGGPIEVNHYARIKRLVGEIKGLLPYKKPYTLVDLQPGYALHADAGSVTDDTFIRADLTRFYLAIQPPRTPAMLAEWLLENANFPQWHPTMMEPLHRIEQGKVAAEEAGPTSIQGGGVGWWTPVGILHAGDPAGAVAEVKNLSRIWKAPLEQDLVAATQAGVAEGMREDATVGSVVDAMLQVCGPLPRQLLERGIEIAEQSNDVWNLAESLYQNVLMAEFDLRGTEEPPREIDAPLPPIRKPLDYSDQLYSSTFLAEQVPLAIAAFVFGKGDPRTAIPCACMIGRDADTTATTVGSWVGALHGESGLPKEWVKVVCEVNLKEIDIRDLAEKLFLLSA